MKPMSKNNREAVSALIAAMYSDWLNALPENEFRQECKRFDSATHLLSAANCLLVAQHELAAQR
jgi:hypothetical protein